jgi:small subunit ribosomal protein S6
VALAMRPYEVMIIFEAGLEEDDIRAGIDRATELIQARGGTLGRLDRWGKRRLSYELNHRTEGYYVLLQAVAPPEAMADLDRMLRLSDEVIRHKVIRLPERVAGRHARPAPSAEPVPAAGLEANGA